jgi:hypothetical protein
MGAEGLYEGPFSYEDTLKKKDLGSLIKIIDNCLATFAGVDAEQRATELNAAYAGILEPMGLGFAARFSRRDSANVEGLNIDIAERGPFIEALASVESEHLNHEVLTLFKQVGRQLYLQLLADYDIKKLTLHLQH